MLSTMPTEPPLTDETLASSLRVSVMRLRRRLLAETDSDLSITAMAVLGWLHRHGDETIGELATRERVQPPSMTRIVTCLADAGYVVRRQGETDRRQVVVSISAAGRARVLADRARRDEWLSRRLADLTPAQRAVLREAAPILEGLATD